MMKTKTHPYVIKPRRNGKAKGKFNPRLPKGPREPVHGAIEVGHGFVVGRELIDLDSIGIQLVHDLRKDGINIGGRRAMIQRIFIFSSFILRLLSLHAPNEKLPLS